MSNRSAPDRPVSGLHQLDRAPRGPASGAESRQRGWRRGSAVSGGSAAPQARRFRQVPR